MSFQTGWVREVQREGGIVFKLCWREKDRNGKWQQRSETMPREINGKPTVMKDAQQRLRTILNDVNGRDGVAMPTSDITFDGLLEKHWADYVERKQLRDSTLDGYRAMLSQWIKPFFGDMVVRKISKETVGQFFRSLRTEGLSDKYQKNVYSLLSKIFELAVAFDVIQVSPVNATLHRPHVFRKEKTTFPAEKLKAFFEALPQEWRTAITVLLLTGMRQGELLGLRWQDIDFNQKRIYMRNVVYRGKLVAGLKDTKREGNRANEVGMVPEVEFLLTTHKEYSSFTTPEAYVFCREDGRPLDPDHMRRQVLYPAMEQAGIEIQDHASGLHMFRHTALSELAKRKGLKAAQAQAGHTNIATTANIYTHVDAEQKLDSALALRDAFAAHLLPASTSATVN